jgi:hypothetical protein
MNMELDMTEISGWIQPLAEGQVAFDELAGKSLARVRYSPKDAYTDLFEGTGHFFEFQFRDSSIFRIDSDRGFWAQYMRTDSEGDQLGEVTDYGRLGEAW